MMIPKNKNPESNVIDDFDDDPLPDWVDVAEALHLLLLQDGTKEELESHRRDPLSRCLLCATGASDEALKAYLFDDDRSLVREFMAQAG
jgi:hypothetical protein